MARLLIQGLHSWYCLKMPSSTSCPQYISAVGCAQSCTRYWFFEYIPKHRNCVPLGRVTVSPSAEHMIVAPSLMSRSLPNRLTGTCDEIMYECVKDWRPNSVFRGTVTGKVIGTPEKPITLIFVSVSGMSSGAVRMVEYVAPVSTKKGRLRP